MSFRVYDVHLRSMPASPLSQSRCIFGPELAAIDAAKKGDETYDSHEERIWRHKFHSDSNGELFIPAMALKYSVVDAAGFSGEKVKGRGNKTWKKLFDGSVLAFEPIMLGQTVDDLVPEALMVPSDGRRGGGSRVVKIFPRLERWEAVAQVIVTVDEIPRAILEKHMVLAGNVVGLGRFRPQNGGYYGRFAVEKIELVEGTETVIKEPAKAKAKAS